MTNPNEFAIPVKLFRRLGRTSALIALIVGLAVLSGWIFNVHFLRSVLAEQSLMKANSAICFIMIGIILLSDSSETKSRFKSRLVIYLPWVPILFGGLTLLEYISGSDLFIDDLFLSSGEDDLAAYPGRMSPIAAFNFIMLGIAFHLNNQGRYHNVSQLLSFIAWLCSLLAFLGFLAAFDEDIAHSGIKTMSVYTSLTFILIIPGILFSRPDKGLVSIALSKSASGLIVRRLIPIAVLSPLLLGWLRIAGERHNFFSPEFGTTLYAVSNIIIFIIMIWWCVSTLKDAEVSRQNVEEALQASGKYIKGFEGRVSEIMDVLLEYTQMNFSRKLQVSERGDELDAIALGLNTLSEEIETKNRFIKKSTERVNVILDTLLQYTMMDFSKKLEVYDDGDELDAISLGLNTLGEELEAAIKQEVVRRKELENVTEEIKRKNLLLSGISELNDVIRGQKDVVSLAQDIINKTVSFLGMPIGAIYITEEDSTLKLTSWYAYKNSADTRVVRLGEGLVGQAALEKKSLSFTDIPDDYIKISSGLGETKPKFIYAIPFLFEGKVMGVIEVGALEEISEIKHDYLNLVSENIAIAINSAMSRQKLEELYQQTQHQAEELESQQEELRQTNVELSRQTQLLQASEEELRVQQEELQQTNEELEQKTQELLEKNDALEETKQALIIKAEEIERTSRYKSEFLANMSHELRTPLNSILILARLLADNRDNNLTDKQVEYSNIIHKSGTDLLNLINDILDLSKIEAGKVDLLIENIPLRQIRSDLMALFRELAQEKKIDFSVNIAKELDTVRINTDKTRLEQILKNLLSNSFKFTDPGGKIELSIGVASPKEVFHSKVLNSMPGNVLFFSVSDTGIGIPQSKQKIVFEAFQQADGSTSRKYGGTGLGLSISRELSNILGGEIHVWSEEGKGSRFTVFLPLTYVEPVSKVSEDKPEIVRVSVPSDSELVTPSSDTSGETSLPDDRSSIGKADKTILIIEDDPNFAKILQDFAHEKGYKTVIALQGDKGFEYAKLYKPNAIILDMQLPVLDGWTLLKKFKVDPELKNIPIHIMSVMDKKKLGIEMGAMAYLQKPVSYTELDRAFDTISSYIDSRIKNILIIEDNEEHSNSVCFLIKNNQKDVNCVSAYTARDALKELKNNEFDCIILDLGLKDMSGIKLLDKIKSDKNWAKIPVIVYTGKDLSREEETRLRKHAATVVLKSSESHKRLLDETALFLHKVEETTDVNPVVKRTFSHKMEEILKDKIVLLADDDMRNVFSLTAALEQQGLKVIAASDGKEALKKLEENKTVDIILMDIMMPEMDGYEAIRQIRKQSRYKDLPILALTAKAMKGDREKCIEAGASDYISKPVNIEQLTSLMRAWLYK